MEQQEALHMTCFGTSTCLAADPRPRAFSSFIETVIDAELDPKSAEAWTNLGVHCDGGTVSGVAYDKKQCYLRALELDPGYARAW